MTRRGIAPEAATAAMLVAFVLGVLTAGWSWTDPTGLPERNVTITEDMPGWDCATMGNQVCGPDAGTIPPVEYVKP